MSVEITRKKYVELCIIIILCAFAITVEVLSLFSVLRPSSESVSSWFQRSGAITLIFAIFAQFRISNFLESIRGSTFAES